MEVNGAWAADQLVEALNRLSPAVGREFTAASALLQPRLTDAEYRDWADAGLGIARNAFRTWESAIEYFRVSPAILDRLSFPQAMRWAAFGRALSNDSAVLSSAYFRASPGVLRHLGAHQIEDWGWLGRNLYQGHWKSGELAAKFFEAGPRLLDLLSPAEIAYLARLCELLAVFSYDVAAESLARAETVLRRIDRPHRRGLLTFLSTVAERNWKASVELLEAAPGVLHPLHPGQRDNFLGLARRMAEVSRDDALALCLAGTPALAQVNPVLHGELIRIAGQIQEIHSGAAVGFLRSAPALTRRAALAGIEQWVREGSRVLRRNHDAGTAFFRIESARAEQALAQISRGVELQSIRDILRLYGKALTGRDVSVRSVEDLADQALGWTAVERPTTDGTTIFLPPYLEHFASKAENFAAYKVLATHQAGHLEFGTFQFDFARPGAIFPTLRGAVARARGLDPVTFVAFERFFDLFPDRALAKDLFTVVEDHRIDARLRTHYRGLRQALARGQQHALEARPDLWRLPAWTALVEFLLQTSLEVSRESRVASRESDARSDQAPGRDRGSPHDDPAIGARLPATLLPLAYQLLEIFRQVELPDARVEDSAEAALRLYALITQVPNVRLVDLVEGDWTADGLDGLADAQALAAGLEPGTGEGLPTYQAVEDVDFRGDLKPELVQTLMKIREDGSDQALGEGAPLSAEELRELLEKGAEIEISALYEGEVNDSMGLFINNLLKQSGKQSAGKLPSKARPPQALPPDPAESLDPAVECYLYPEWDFRSGDYRPDWCRLKQRPIEEGTERFYEDTLAQYAGLAMTLRRQFELIRPELFKKLKRLQDGEEYDLDEVIAAAIERRAGLTPSDKIYWRKNKIERDVAVAFLIDMSASTDEEIKDDHGRVAFPLPVQPAPRVHRPPHPAWLPPDDDPAPLKGKRIIDLEKESIVLLIQALETLGDTYGIYGFSGYGRENVDFYVIKDLDEAFGDRIKRRIEKIEPVRSTRMGPAIRHAIAKLDRRNAKLKAIILVSDGRPQDYDYGKDRTEKDYAIHDTKTALLEAKQKHIVPFCLTVDKAGHDWMKTMCEDIGYEVVDDIEVLPRRLPSLYRKLTT